MIRRNLAIALCINLFFLALCLIFGDLKYGAIDDYFMAAVLTGAHGTDYNPHLLFVNALYGYALIPLYKLFPTIGWYYIGEMFSVFLSLTTISYIIIKKMGNRWGTLIATLLVALLASDFYLVVQFTQCASLLSAAGMLVFATAVCEGKRAPFAYAIFLLLWGSIMRWEAFLMGMPFFCVGLLFLIKKCWAKKIQVAIALLIMFVVAFGIRTWDRDLYMTPKYKSYMEIQDPRAALGDSRNYNANAVIEDLIESEKSSKDFDLLTSWIFYDTESFSKDSMQSFVDIMNNYRNKIEEGIRPKLLLQSIGNSIHSPLFVLWALACLIILCTNKHKFIYTWASLAPICYMLFLLITTQRATYRVENGLWLYAAIMAISQWETIKNEKLNRLLSNKATIIVIVIILLANIFSYAKSNGTVRNPATGETRTLAVNDSTDYSQVLAHIDSTPNTMFLTNMRTYMVFSHHKMPPYKAEPFGSYRNIISFGYWTPYLPEITQALAEYGITNPMRQVVDSNVVVINEPNLRDFLTRHYYSDSIAVDTLLTVGKTEFYKYRLVQK